MADNPETRLVVYGSLGPGEANAFMLAGLVGAWQRCTIRGHLGRYQGFKSFRYDREGPEQAAWLLESAELPRILPDLDDFEGEDYERIIIPAEVNGRLVMAQVYAGRYGG
jgi:gamma-glutamylcyclotransferase (GGCT)/AIG2-like uncharacterized protein YtfP